MLRRDRLRWPIPADLKFQLLDQKIGCMSRRAKYLLMPVEQRGTLILHLGMSGSLRVVLKEHPVERHDHVDIIFSEIHALRYTDPRRFGALLWTDEDPHQHVLLRSLGPEPLASSFTSSYLKAILQRRRTPIKTAIMDSRVVVGVGNIYAAEALFVSRLHPEKPAGLLTDKECDRLVAAIQSVLQSAIQQGGTTVKSFMNSEGKPGYFTQALQVYGRRGLPCFVCHQSLEWIKISGRTTVFCGHCQRL